MLDVPCSRSMAFFWRPSHEADHQDRRAGGRGMLLAFLGLPLLGLATALGPSDLLQTLARSDAIRHPALAADSTCHRFESLLGNAGCLVAVARAWPRRQPGARRAQASDRPTPAVLGVGLLETFGRSGLFGPALSAIGASLPFSTAAVVLAGFLWAARSTH